MRADLVTAHIVIGAVLSDIRYLYSSRRLDVSTSILELVL